MKRTLSILLALLLIALTVPAGVFAASATTSGDLDYSFCTWTLDDNGTLTINGHGGIPEVSVAHQTWRETVTSIVIGNGVEGIGGNAFQFFTALKSVKIGRSVHTICDGAFNECTSLTSVVIPDSVTEIGEGAFRKCCALKSVTIGKGLTTLRRRTFEDCTALENVTFDKTTLHIERTAFQNCKEIRNVYLTDIASWCGSMIDEPLLSNGGTMYLNGKPLTDLTIPNSLTRISRGTFAGNLALKSLTIGDTAVYNVEDYAFKGCANLTTVKLGKDVTGIFDEAFSGCTSLTSIDLANVRVVCADAFKGCTSLSKVSMGNDMGVIYRGAFTDCPKLKTIRIPQSVTNIEANAFDSGVTIQGYKGGYVENYAKKAGLKFENVSGDDNNYVGDCAWKLNGTALTISGKGSIPTGYTPWGKKITSLTIEEGVTGIGNEAFRYCTELTAVKLPRSLTSIGACAFAGCSKLKNINLPDGVTEIGSGAFMGCAALKSVTLPASLVGLSDSAFANCVSLESVTFGEKLRYEQGRVFSGCTALKTIRGVPGSFAETFAKQNNLSFEDVNARVSGATLSSSAAAGSEGASSGASSTAELGVTSSGETITSESEEALTKAAAPNGTQTVGSPSETTDSAPFPWIWVIVGGAAFVLAIVGGVLIYLKKKKA